MLPDLSPVMFSSSVSMSVQLSRSVVTQYVVTQYVVTGRRRAGHEGAGIPETETVEGQLDCGEFTTSCNSLALVLGTQQDLERFRRENYLLSRLLCLDSYFLSALHNIICIMQVWYNVCTQYPVYLYFQSWT